MPFHCSFDLHFPNENLTEFVGHSYISFRELSIQVLCSFFNKTMWQKLFTMLSYNPFIPERSPHSFLILAFKPSFSFYLKACHVCSSFKKPTFGYIGSIVYLFSTSFFYNLYFSFPLASMALGLVLFFFYFFKVRLLIWDLFQHRHLQLQIFLWAPLLLYQLVLKYNFFFFFTFCYTSKKPH